MGVDAGAIRERFASHDLRWTKQREEVYAALMSSCEHPTAEELFAVVGSSDQGGEPGGISLATVYNTLEALVRCGLARRVSGGECCALSAAGAGGAARYDADLRDHAHLLGADGCVRDIPGELGRRIAQAVPREVVEEVERALGVRIERLRIDLIERAPSSDK